MENKVKGNLSNIKGGNEKINGNLEAIKNVVSVDKKKAKEPKKDDINSILITKIQGPKSVSAGGYYQFIITKYNYDINNIRNYLAPEGSLIVSCVLSD